MSKRQSARQQLIEGLRAVAEFYESYPQAYDDGMMLVLSMYVSGHGANNTLAAMSSLLGECEQSYDQGFIAVSKIFSPRVKLEIFSRLPVLNRWRVLAATLDRSARFFQCRFD